jgi:hypothetical protein
MAPFLFASKVIGACYFSVMIPIGAPGAELPIILNT